MNVDFLHFYDKNLISLKIINNQNQADICHRVLDFFKYPFAFHYTFLY
ncbi:MAG: hypothetical protein RHS_5154 [Robinsoniella sp. RHS]|nr:MAG: hypothetical protein RHS_5154 [Robinsoniella sp. RHS]